MHATGWPHAQAGRHGPEQVSSLGMCIASMLCCWAAQGIAARARGHSPLSQQQAALLYVGELPAGVPVKMCMPYTAWHCVCTMQRLQCCPGWLQMIKDTMDKKFGAPWHVVAGGYFSYEITYEVHSSLPAWAVCRMPHASAPAFSYCFTLVLTS